MSNHQSLLRLAAEPRPTVKEKAMTEQQLPVFITAFGDAPTQGTATIVEQTPGERTFRTPSGVGMFWALALGGLFIPLAHSVLVPTFLIAGIVMGIKRSREDRRLLGIRGTCPRCGIEQRFHLGGRFFDGRTFDCPRCHNYLRVEGRTQ
jgi:hypothetical protein